MDSEGLLKESFGLNSYESRVYLVLLKGSMNASEIAQESGVPQSRTYDTLRELGRKGFVSEREGVYAAVKPSTALRARMARFRAEFGAQQAAREGAMKEILEETEELTSRAHDSAEPVMLRGIDSIGAAFLEVLRSSDEVILVVRKGLRTSAEFLSYVRDAEKVKTRIRVLVPKNARLSARELGEAKRLGLEVRRSSAAFLDVMVGDSDDVIIGVPAKGEDESFRAVGIWMKDRSFSAALRSTLEGLRLEES